MIHLALLSLSASLAAVPWSVDTPLVTAAPGSSPDAGVVVGIEHYQDSRIPAVLYAGRDADAFAAYLLATRGLAADHVQRLDSPTRSELLAALATARDQAKKRRGRVWVYFAGHGWRVVPAEGPVEQVLVLYDATPTPDGLVTHGLTEGQVWSTLRGVPAEVVVDACFEGGAREGALVDPGSRFITVAHPASTPPEGLSAWRAVSSGQVALPFREAEHGLFTFLWLAGARGWADGAPVGPGAPSERDGRVTAAENAAWLRSVAGEDATQTPEWEGDGSVELSRAGKGRPLETGPSVDELREWLPLLARTEGAFGGDVSRWLEWRRGMDAWFATEEKALQARATKAWAEVKAYLNSGSPNGRAAVEKYIEQYRGASLERDGEFTFVPVPELEDAWVALGRPEDTGLPGYGDEMTLIPGGWFRQVPNTEMSTPWYERAATEATQVDTFELARLEVSQELFDQYRLVEYAATFQGVNLLGEDLPAQSMGWCMAVSFANWATSRWNLEHPERRRVLVYSGVERCAETRGHSVAQVEGANGFRLPSGAEWEYAARAGSQRAWGSDGDVYSGTSEPSEVCAYGNVGDLTIRALDVFWDANFDCSDASPGASPVGSYRPSGWGLFDMTGNVHEWTYGLYKGDAGVDGWHAFRGGSWRDGVHGAWIAPGPLHMPDNQGPWIGLRLARSLP